MRCGRPVWPVHRSGCPAEPETKCRGTSFTPGPLPCLVSSHRHPKNLLWSCQHLLQQALLPAGCPARALRGQGPQGTSRCSRLCAGGAEDGRPERGAKRQSCPRKERTVQDPAPAGSRELCGARARPGRGQGAQRGHSKPRGGAAQPQGWDSTLTGSRGIRKGSSLDRQESLGQEQMQQSTHQRGGNKAELSQNLLPYFCCSHSPAGWPGSGSRWPGPKVLAPLTLRPQRATSGPSGTR